MFRQIEMKKKNKKKLQFYAFSLHLFTPFLFFVLFFHSSLLGMLETNEGLIFRCSSKIFKSIEWKIMYFVFVFFYVM